MGFGISIGVLASSKQLFIGAILAGGNVGGSQTTSMAKFQWKTETTQALASTLASPKYLMAAYTNPGIAGYAVGGIQGESAVTSIEKVSYATETRSSAGSNTTLGRYFNSSYYGSNSGSHAYVVGGFSGGNLTSGEKYVFSTETSSNLASGLSDSRRGGFSMTNNGSGMYAFCGETSNFYTMSNRIDKWTFSNDTRTSYNNTLAISADSYGFYFSNSGSHGYAFAAFYNSGGTQASITGFAYKWFFASESVGLVSQYAFYSSYPVSVSLYNVAGYVLGDGSSTTAIKYTFNVETFSTLSQSMPATRGFPAKMANSIGN